VLVGALAFLETGAFVGLLAPGETTIIVGGVVAGQGQIDIVALIAIVWACAVAGDVTSFLLGRRLGRAFLVRHGPKVQITPERLRQVEDFFARHGGAASSSGASSGSSAPWRRSWRARAGCRCAGSCPTTSSGRGCGGRPSACWATPSGARSGRARRRQAGAFALGTTIAVVVGRDLAVPLPAGPEHRQGVWGWLDRQGERP
jgi:undecaprenyl-diphosphatase